MRERKFSETDVTQRKILVGKKCLFIRIHTAKYLFTWVSVKNFFLGEAHIDGSNKGARGM